MVRVVVTGECQAQQPLEATVPAKFLAATDPVAVLAESAAQRGAGERLTLALTILHSVQGAQRKVGQGIKHLGTRN